MKQEDSRTRADVADQGENVEWVFYVAGVVLAGGLGYGGGQLALRHDRERRADEPASTRTAARFRLEHLDGLTWELLNVGDAPAALVRILPLVDGLEQWPPQPAAGQLQSATSELLPTLAPGASMSVWFSRHDAGQQAIVSWTAEDDVRMGPVRLAVPPPR